MNDGIHDYFKTELKHFQKSYELQVNHFMGLFYFWIGVVTLPATAVLLTSERGISPSNLAILALLIAIVSQFISIEMIDIRCSQLKYAFLINEIRQQLFDAVQGGIESYNHPYSNTTNLREVARKDFGAKMVFVMSLVNAIFFGFSIHLFFGVIFLSAGAFLSWFLIGYRTYFVMINKRVPEATKKRPAD